MFHIFYHNDLDGKCAGAIMYRCAKENSYEIKLHEVDYKDSIDLDMVKYGDSVGIVDFSFKPDVIEQLRKKVLIIWCDHHTTAKDYGYDDLLGYRDFEDKGLSGCECTWKYCYPDKTIPHFIELIGDYDSWRMKKTPDSLLFYEGMKLIETAPDSFIWNELFKDEWKHLFNKICDEGKIAINYRNSYCDNVRKSYGYETKIDGIKAYATNIYMFGSQGFGEKFKQYPICIAYIFDGTKFSVSLYSETVDVSVIAKVFGGGGHKGAAGFTCKELPFVFIKR